MSARLLCALIRAYQRAFAWRSSPCRFSPTCSVYAHEAIERHGAVRGLWLAGRRIARCNPWGGFGMDPVPSRDAEQATATQPADSGMRLHGRI